MYIILLYHDTAGFDMNLGEWESICPKAWKNDCDYSQINSFANIGEGRYTIRNCNKITYKGCTPETKTI